MSRELIERIVRELDNEFWDEETNKTFIDCKAEIERLQLANETLSALNVEYLERVKLLETELWRESKALELSKQEPVAWMYSVGDRKEVLFREFHQDELVDGCLVTPLYTSPQCHIVDNNKEKSYG